MGKGGKALKFLFGVAVLVGLAWLLFFGIVADRATATTMSIKASSTREFKRWEFVAKAKINSHHDFHFDYVSKRRVPNGPDPIHNRKASLNRSAYESIFSKYEYMFDTLSAYMSSIYIDKSPGEHQSRDNLQVEARCERQSNSLSFLSKIIIGEFCLTLQQRFLATTLLDDSTCSRQLSLCFDAKRSDIPTLPSSVVTQYTSYAAYNRENSE
ncbi:hypothetical protein V6N13_052950 [Hibiscus sabdariffa]|uniref:Uncharacterized protein n=1 Tax=Hibiscus sabdariffa TaxID=183260 RepID=A0ABR2AU61_9ROSI